MIDLRIGDCIELAEDLDDDSIDCTVTSPPYNKQKIGGGLFVKLNTKTLMTPYQRMYISRNR